MQSLQKLLCFTLLDRLIAIHGIQQDIGINGVHAIDHDSTDHRRS